MTAVAPSVAPPTLPASTRLSFGRVVRSEWIKLFSLRSTWWSLAITVALSVGISLMIAAASRDFAPGFATVGVIVMPMQFTMLVAGILGAIAITGEYSTGMIRSTFAAQPRRGVVLAAKALVVGFAMALTTAVTFALAAVLTAPIVAPAAIDWSDAAQSWFPLVMGVFAMATFSLMGLGWGFIIRNGAGAIATTVGLLFVAPVILSLFSVAGDAWRWLSDASVYLPMSAAQNVTTAGGEDVLRGALTLTAWVVGLLLVAWVMLRSRDA